MNDLPRLKFTKKKKFLPICEKHMVLFGTTEIAVVLSSKPNIYPTILQVRKKRKHICQRVHRLEQSTNRPRAKYKQNNQISKDI